VAQVGHATRGSASTGDGNNHAQNPGDDGGIILSLLSMAIRFIYCHHGK